MRSFLSFALMLGLSFQSKAFAHPFTPYILLCEPQEQNSSYGRYLLTAQIYVMGENEAVLKIISADEKEPLNMPTPMALGVGVFDTDNDASGLLHYRGRWINGSNWADLAYVRHDRSGDILQGTLTLEHGCKFAVTCKMR